jgi:hypothetical protein
MADTHDCVEPLTPHASRRRLVYMPVPLRLVTVPLPCLLRYMDLQYWSPLVFVLEPASGLELPQQLSWLDWFVIDMA